jgi:hypothetical protein
VESSKGAGDGVHGEHGARLGGAAKISAGDTQFKLFFIQLAALFALPDTHTKNSLKNKCIENRYSRTNSNVFTKKYLTTSVQKCFS